MSSARRLLGALTRNRWLRAGVLLAAVAVSLVGVHRVPEAALLPALLGLAPWVLGKYVLCPLRWHALSASGHSRRWHIRVYAEAELLGLVSPAHAGADLWRLHKLERSGMNRPCAAAEVALDRLVGAVGLTLFVLLAGAALPPQLLVVAGVGALIVLLAALAVRRLRPGMFTGRPLPSPGVLARGVALSMGYQLTILCLFMGTVSAMGQEVHPLQLLAVFGASQVAGIIPGVHGASPREGALVLGLASLGLPLSAAFGAVALATLLAWLPALTLGGTSLAVRRLMGPRAAMA